MPISDLTGTTWRFDTTVLTPASSAVEYNLICQYHIAGNDYYISDEYGDTQPGVIRAPSANRIFGWTGYNEAIEQSGTTGEWRVYSYEDHETIVDWTDYFDITIDGGTDATNSTLISWVDTNADQQSSQLSVDLSTLSGWSNVSSGSHTLKVKAKATGYQDSALSEGASFVKGGTTYTVNLRADNGFGAVPYWSPDGYVKYRVNGSTVGMITTYGVSTTLTGVGQLEISCNRNGGFKNELRDPSDNTIAELEYDSWVDVSEYLPTIAAESYVVIYCED